MVYRKGDEGRNEELEIVETTRAARWVGERVGLLDAEVGSK